MEKSIDLYSRLLIATITFVVPIIINLLSTFTSGEKRRKELSKVTEENLSKQTAQEIQANPATVKETVTKTYGQYAENDKKTKQELKLLNPIIQFWTIAIPLFCSFVLLFFAYLVKANYCDLYNHYLSLSILVTSVIFYIIALCIIIRIMYTISKTKKIVDL